MSNDTLQLKKRIADLLDRNEAIRKSNDEIFGDMVSLLEELMQYQNQIQSTKLQAMLDKYIII
ncbi:hypothetical protein ACI3PL_31455 [Lacticaseibacillus paracasei]